MKDIDRRLTEAGDETREKMSAMPLTGVAPYARGRDASRLVAAGAAFVLVLGVVGVAAIAATWGPISGTNDVGSNVDDGSVTSTSLVGNAVAGDDDMQDDDDSQDSTTSTVDDDDDSTTSTTLDDDEEDDDSTTSTTLDDDEEDDDSTTSTTLDDDEPDDDDSTTTTTLSDDDPDDS